MSLGHYWPINNPGAAKWVKSDMGNKTSSPKRESLLPYGWWLPTATPASFRCSRSGLRIALDYGEFNNRLTTFAHGLALSASVYPHPVLKFTHGTIEEWAQYYDLEPVLRGWACVEGITVHWTGTNYTTVASEKVYMLGHAEGGDVFVHTVIGLVLTTYTAHTETLLLQARRKWTRWHAVHMRRLCRAWVSDELVLACTVDAQTADDLCLKNTTSLQGTLAQARAKFGSATSLLLHDSLWSTDELVRTAQIVEGTPFRGKSVHEDMMIMVHSEFFFGNLASTLSLNVHRARRLLFRRDSHRRTNLRLWERACFDFVPGAGIAESKKRFVFSSRGK